MTRKTPPAEPPASKADTTNAPNRMWGGRFDASPDAVMEAINASIDFDRRLYAEDITDRWVAQDENCNVVLDDTPGVGFDPVPERLDAVTAMREVFG